MAESTPGAAAESVSSLTAEIRKLKQELATLDPNSQAFQDLAEKAGEVKDQMNDAAEAMNANAGSAFERLGNNSGLLKDRLMNLDFEGVGQSVKSLAGNISSVKFSDIIGGIKGMTSAFSALGKALLANPIFLLVSALVAIGMAIKGILDQQRADVDAANEAIDKSNEKRHLAEKKRLAEAGNDLQKQRELKEEFARKDIEATQKQIDNLIKLQRTPYGLSEEQEKKLDELRKQLAEQRVNYEIEAINRLNQLNDERLKVQERYENIGLSQREIRKKQLEKEYKDEVARLIALGISTEELYKVDAYYESEMNKLVQEAEKEKADARRAAAEKRKADAEAAKAQQEKSDKEYFEWSRAETNKFLEQKNKDEVDALVNNIKTIEPAVKQWHGAQLQMTKEQVEADKLLQKEKFAAQVQLASDALGSLMALNDAFQNGSEKSAKRAFQINKALSLAQAIMSTYQAVNAQLAVPQSALTGTSYIKAGIALAAGLANVAKIAKTQFQSSAPSGGGGAGGGGLGGGSLAGGGASMTSVTPSFNPLNTSFLNNRPGQTGAVQAYVLSSNVSSAMEANQKVKDQTVL